MDSETHNKVSHTRQQQSLAKTLLVIGILLIAANLRAPFTGVPPLLGMIQTDLGLGATAASVLTTLPLLAFALISPFGSLFAREYGLERTLFGALVAIAAGILLRSSGAVWMLYLGTGLIGAGIAVGNVLLPSLVKRDFPDNIAAMTGAYAISMGVAAALFSAAAVPLAHAWGWIGTLAAFIVLPLIAIAVWVFQLGSRSKPTTDTATPPHGGRIWHSALAWQVTFFLGLNSTIYYIAIGYLPAILVDAGLTPERAGSLHGILQLATAIPGLLMAPILGRLRDQRIPAVAVALMSTIALVGILLAPQCALIWSVLFGLGTGAGIILGLSFIGLRSGNAVLAGALSGMSQCIGYLLAAAGPPLIAVMHESLGGWQWPLGTCIGLSLLAAMVGVLVGRDRQIGV